MICHIFLPNQALVTFALKVLFPNQCMTHLGIGSLGGVIGVEYSRIHIFTEIHVQEALVTPGLHHQQILSPNLYQKVV